MATIVEKEMQFDLYALIQDLGQTVTIRNLTTVPGAQPYPNPFVYSGLVASAASSGATSLTLSAPLLNGRLIANDQLVVGADPTTYIVGSTCTSISNTITPVFSPGLSLSVSAGESVAISFSADNQISALVTNMPSRLVNGTTIQASDRNVRFLANSISFTPTVTDKVIIGADTYSIVLAKPIQIQDTIYGWSCQVRK